MFSLLPFDLLQYIVDFIHERSDLLSLQLVSRVCDSAVLPKLWRVVHEIHGEEQHASDQIWHVPECHFRALRSLSSDRVARFIATHVRELVLTCKQARDK